MIRVHGGRERAPAGLGKPWFDLSANMNPFGMPRGLESALSRVDVSSYPDHECVDLRKDLSSRFGGDSYESVVLSNGATELIWLLAYFASRGNYRCLSIKPSFCEWEAAADHYMLDLVTLNSIHMKYFDWSDLESEISSKEINLVYLCRPNSPSGCCMSLDKLNEISRRFQNVLFIVDESFLSMSSYSDELFRTPLKNQILLRSLTKDLALPGVRLGYGVGPEDIMSHIHKSRPYWSLNSYALSAMKWYLSIDYKCITKSVMSYSKTFQDQLKALGLSLFPSDTIFFMFYEPSGADFSVELKLEAGIALRNCRSYGHEDLWRMGLPKFGDGPYVLRQFKRYLERTNAS